jgi:guanylate kinase
MKTSKKLASALIALGLAFGAVGADMATTEAASVSEIAQINVKKDGSNFQYWNQDSASFKALKAYVEDVTNPSSPNFIPVKDRVCVSDMDGTFYGELAPTYSEWYLYFHRMFNDPTYNPSPTEKAYALECLKAAKAGKISADMDEGEDRAQSYAFQGMSMEDFDKYVDNYYGTPSDPLAEMVGKGQDVLFDITIEGSLALNRKFDDDTVTIFILPPSMEELENRLRGRGTETEEKVQKRLEQAKSEIRRAGEFEYIVTNDDLEKAARDILAIITAEKLKASKNIHTAKELE